MWHSSCPPLSSYPPSPSHQSPCPDLSSHYKGASKEVPLKERPKRSWKEAHVYEPFNTIHQGPENNSFSRGLPDLYWYGQNVDGQSNWRLQVSCDRFFIWDRINQISQVCPHVLHPPPILLCRLHSWRQRAWLSIQTFLTVIYYRYRVPPSTTIHITQPSLSLRAPA